MAGLLTSRRVPTTLRVLRHRDYALYTFGNGISLTGSWMQRLAMRWLMWEMTGSGTWLGILAAADLLPVTVIGPAAGVAADRWSRLTLTRISQVVSGLIAVLLAVLVALDVLNVALLVMLATASGSMVALNQPARMALVQVLVPRADVGSAVALSSVNVNLARIIGPALAGWMIVHLPVEWTFLCNAGFTFFFVAILLRLHPDATPPWRPRAGFRAEIAEGFSYTLGRKDVRELLLFLCLGGMVLRSMLELAPALAARSFETGAVGLAFLTSAMAAGAVAAGLFGASQKEEGSLIRQALVGWAAGALAVCILALGGVPVVDATAMAALGFFITRAVVGTQTYVQLTVPDEMRGRALSLHGLVSRGSPAIGALAIGALSDVIGLMPPVLAGGIVLLVAAAVAWMRAERSSGP